jgi:hypothetical protein
MGDQRFVSLAPVISRVGGRSNQWRNQMRKLLPGMAIGLSLAVFPLASLVIPAAAKDQTVTVTIGGAFADALAEATGIAVADLPTSLSVPRGIANNVCGAKVDAGATCEGAAKAKLLVGFLGGEDDESSATSDDDESTSSSSDDDSSESSEEPNDNSAKAFAPGQVKGDGESAKDYAPGHTKEDGGNASDQAPGHQKGGDGKGGKK